MNSFGKTEGKVLFHVNVKVDASEMKDWEPESILRFFRGIAEVIRAAGRGIQ
ncbi:MAG: hypothetical protein ACRDQZ_09185 [Mycobacteriales bacterium]